jgi:hypothetical protein
MVAHWRPQNLRFPMPGVIPVAICGRGVASDVSHVGVEVIEGWWSTDGVFGRRVNSTQLCSIVYI